MTRRGRLLVVLLLACVLLLPACKPKEPEVILPPRALTNEIFIAHRADAGILDGRGVRERLGFDMATLVYSSLARLDATLAPVPDLATSWQVSSDGKVYTFVLNKNARFHDGKPVTSDDVKFTFETLKSCNSTYAGLFPIESITAPDANTVVFNLEYALAPFVKYTAVIGIMPKHLTDPVKLTLEPLGSGPFKFVKYVRGDRMVLERNADYYGQKPQLQRITFRIIPEATVRALELATGGVDIAVELPVDYVKMFLTQGVFTIFTHEGGGYAPLYINMAVKPFDDLRVRQAIAYAIDRQEIIDVLYDGWAKPAYQILPGDDFFFNSQAAAAVPRYDPQKSRALLAEAGFAPGTLEVQVHARSAEEHRRIGELIVYQLNDAGFKASLDIAESTVSVERARNHEFQLYVSSIQFRMDIDQSADETFHSRYVKINSNNYSNYANTRVDELIEIGRKAADQATRKVAYDELLLQLAKDLPVVPIRYSATMYGVHPLFSGFNFRSYSWYYDMGINGRWNTGK